jgi:hypothetical protein
MFLLTTPSNQLHLEKEKNMKHSMSAQIFSLLLAVLFVFCGIPAIAAEPQQESTDQVVSTNIPAIDKNGPSIEKDQGNIVL